MGKESDIPPQSTSNEVSQTVSANDSSEENVTVETLLKETEILEYTVLHVFCKDFTNLAVNYMSKSSLLVDGEVVKKKTITEEVVSSSTAQVMGEGATLVASAICVPQVTHSWVSRLGGALGIIISKLPAEWLTKQKCSNIMDRLYNTVSDKPILQVDIWKKIALETLFSIIINYYIGDLEQICNKLKTVHTPQEQEVIFQEIEPLAKDAMKALQEALDDRGLLAEFVTLLKKVALFSPAKLVKFTCSKIESAFSSSQKPPRETEDKFYTQLHSALMSTTMGQKKRGIVFSSTQSNQSKIWVQSKHVREVPRLSELVFIREGVGEQIVNTQYYVPLPDFDLPKVFNAIGVDLFCLASKVPYYIKTAQSSVMYKQLDKQGDQYYGGSVAFLNNSNVKAEDSERRNIMQTLYNIIMSYVLLLFVRQGLYQLIGDGHVTRILDVAALGLAIAAPWYGTSWILYDKTSNNHTKNNA